MKLRIDLHIHDDSENERIAARLWALNHTLLAITNTLLTAAGKPAAQPQMETFDMKTTAEILDELTSTVARLKTVAPSIPVIITGLRAALKKAIEDGKANDGLTDEQAARFEALDDEIDSMTDGLVAASVENTPDNPNP